LLCYNTAAATAGGDVVDSFATAAAGGAHQGVYISAIGIS